MLEMQIAFEKAYVASVTDPDKNIQLYAPDATAWLPGQPPMKGREALVASAKNLLSQFSDARQTDVRMWTKGHTLVLQWVQTATHKASGKPVGFSGLEIFTFNDDGLVVTDHTYTDIETIMEQTGEYKGQKAAPPVLSPPSAPVELHSAKNDATEDANAAAIVATNAAWFKKDDKTFLGSFTDDFVSYSASGKQHDKKFLVGNLAAVRKAVDATALKDVNVIAVEDFTINEEEGSYTQKAAYSFDGYKLPNTKKSATTHSVEIDQWKDGKIVKSWSWENGLEMDAQLGTGPAAPKKKVAAAAKNLKESL